MKNLENFGVQELNTKEMENTNGGFLTWLVGTAIVAGIIYVLASMRT